MVFVALTSETQELGIQDEGGEFMQGKNSMFGVLIAQCRSKLKPPKAALGVAARLTMLGQHCNGTRTVLCKRVPVPHSTGKRPELRTLFPLTAFKNARNPKFVQNLSQRLFWGVPVTGAEIWKNLLYRSRPDHNQIRRTLRALHHFSARRIRSC